MHHRQGSGRERNRKRMMKMKKKKKGTGGPGTTTGGGVGGGGGGSEPAPLAEGCELRADPGRLAAEQDWDSELEQQFDGVIDGADRFGNYIEGVIADALGDGGMDVGAGAHSGGDF